METKKSDFSLNLLVGSRFDDDAYPLIVIVRDGVDSFLDGGIVSRTGFVHIYGGLWRSTRVRCIGNEQETYRQVKDECKRRHPERKMTDDDTEE